MTYIAQLGPVRIQLEASSIHDALAQLGAWHEAYRGLTGHTLTISAITESQRPRGAFKLSDPNLYTALRESR